MGGDLPPVNEMAFAKFDITELPDDSEDDYAVEFTTANSKLGITLSEGEMNGVSQMMQEAIDGDLDKHDGKNAAEI